MRRLAPTPIFFVSLETRPKYLMKYFRLPRKRCDEKNERLRERERKNSSKVIYKKKSFWTYRNFHYSFTPKEPFRYNIPPILHNNNRSNKHSFPR